MRKVNYRVRVLFSEPNGIGADSYILKYFIYDSLDEIFEKFSCFRDDVIHNQTIIGERLDKNINLELEFSYEPLTEVRPNQKEIIDFFNQNMKKIKLRNRYWYENKNITKLELE